MQVELLQKPLKLQSKNKCFHCNQPIAPGIEYSWKHQDTTNYYCCNGCKAVSQIILESDNQFFYEMRGSQNLEPIRNPEEEAQIRAEYLDGSIVASDYLTEIQKGIFEVQINITNIHCSACVWLNEKVLKDTSGIETVRINFATGLALIQFNPEFIKLSKIFQIIESIGYLPRLHSSWNQSEATNKNNSLLIRMGLAGFCFGNIMLFGTSLYAGYFTGIELEFKRLLHYLSWAFATPVYLYSGYPFLRGAWQAIKRGKFSMDFLLVTGISLAYFYSIFVTLTDIGEVYFDSVCMIYFFILLGKYLEENARRRANDKLNQLLTSLPEVATVLGDNGEINYIRTSEVIKGQKLLIKNGERVPVDGTLISDIGELNESFLTGESSSIQKKKDDSILAGSIAINRPIEILAESNAKNSTLSRLKIMIDRALGQKPNLERITDKISGYFIAVIFSVAIATFLFWFLSDAGIETAIINTIAVLIVACPCALGLAVPTALVMNHIRNSKDGIVIKNPDIIEPLSKLQTIFFDKTGTLTQGKLELSSHNFSNPNLAGAITYCIESKSNHPVAINLRRTMEENHWIDPAIQLIDVIENPGLGMSGKISISDSIHNFKLGSAKFLDISENPKHTRVHLSLDENYLGYWELSDQLRNDSLDAIRSLKKIVKNIFILSGDNISVVKNIANKLNISQYLGSVSPENKLTAISEAQNRNEVVAMVGDGINDSAAMAKADIGVSMGVASDISLDRSDIILVNNNIRGIYLAACYAKETSRKIKQNIAISFFYNSLMVPLAAMGFMAPVLCAVFMATSSLTVVGNSLLLRKKIFVDES
ncbi:heavy metal translocating P-type ATPase [Leptospira sp. GIMC2001]|uniref:heavy metal translocating P-type ATPase n=1 Tax=Leptospira sp. GIMC2001 TaxID=1513297 RepID=UPI00234B9D6D|nr:heavy metal translocating P-type ATPase [Leptospira sp. GIMC2001]WCL50505.1 heavy metal translocating P-type ATPase metal-binding domain-containing protein [Leptospira sp. GIMC2001]